MSIRTKLILSFLLIALLVGVLGVFGYSNLKNTSKQVDVITEGETPILVRLTEMRSIILEGVEEQIAKLSDERLEDVESPDDPIVQSGQEEQAELLGKMVTARQAMIIAARTLIENYELLGTTNKSDLAAFEAGIDNLIPIAARFLEIENQEVVEAQQDIQATIAGAQRQTIIVISAAVVLAIGLGLLVSRSISIPINKLRDAALRIGRGELDTLIDIRSKDEIGELAVSFNSMVAARRQAEEQRGALIAALEDKNAELERFTYTVSHDLKSPLITVKGFLGALEHDIAQGNTARMKADMARISAGADRMSGLLDELLELSRIGRVVGTPEEVPLGEVARDAVALVAGFAEERKVQVKVADGLPVVFGDRLRIQEVLQNLVENAIKFMGDEPVPLVEIGGLQRNGESVYFVRDNGMGIDPRYSHKVFDLFDKLDRNTEGTGIGLALVKRIVEVHGGRVWVESEGLGHGSTFYFTLPSKGGKPLDDRVPIAG